ncbi:hypothetical protein [Methyloglobulus sp.]|uniref:hypothetical protein n=1 Tax=Methyloglobulus sp. TaxID=2518622 RepID=UPI00398A3F41
MNILKITATSLLILLVACDNSSKNVSADSKSAQKAANDFSKTFQQASTKDSQKMNSAKKLPAAKKPAPETAGIAGLPKDAVEGAKKVIDETKEMATKAVEKISNIGSDDNSSTGKAGNGRTDIDMDKNAQNADKSPKAATNTTSAQQAAESEAPQLTKEEPANGSQPANTSRKSDPESAGVAGLPKDAVEGAKKIVNETKEMATKAAEEITN